MPFIGNHEHQSINQLIVIGFNRNNDNPTHAHLMIWPRFMRRIVQILFRIVPPVPVPVLVYSSDPVMPVRQFHPHQPPAHQPTSLFTRSPQSPVRQLRQNRRNRRNLPGIHGCRPLPFLIKSDHRPCPSIVADPDRIYEE